MSRFVLLGGVAAIALCAAPLTAWAQCAPDPVANGGSVTCSGTDTNGFTSSATGITVTVEPGASVTRGGDNDAVRVNGAGTTVSNNGTIDGSDEGIDARGANSSIANAAGASITGADRGIDADGVAGLTVTNTGAITGTASDAIRAGAGLTVTNNLGGTITGADEGIQTTTGLTFTNHGTLDAADEGIEATDDATFINSGTITGVDDAIQTDDNTSITNTGTIESTENDAVDIDSGAVINSGIIRATDTGEDGIDFDPDAADVVSTVDNQAGGLIEGEIGINTDPLNDRAQAITNAGTITGRSGVALFLEEGNDSLTMLQTGVINGISDFGAGEDLLTLDGPQAAVVGGGSYFDGGIGIDLVQFSVSFDRFVELILTPRIDPEAFALSFLNADDSLSTVYLARWENFAFTDRTVGYDDLVSAVPLPAPALLLGGGLGLLALLRRRKRAA